MQRFTLIRHGQSTGNIGEPMRGRGTPPLTELGWEQAHATAAAFEYAPALIVASNMVRAQQTAQPLRARFPKVPFEIWPVHEFMPLKDHWYEAMPKSERIAHFYGFFGQDDPNFRFQPDTESFADGIGRAAALLERVKQHPDVVVFAHGTFLKFVYWTWLMGSPERARETMVACGHAQPAMHLPNCAQVSGLVDDFGRIYLSPPQPLAAS